MAPAARAEMESWFDGKERAYSEVEGGSEEEKEKHTSRSFVVAVCLFANLIIAPPSWFLGVRLTRSRNRGSAISLF
jgi:hypothetical protein